MFCSNIKRAGIICGKRIDPVNDLEWFQTGPGRFICGNCVDELLMMSPWAGPSDVSKSPTHATRRKSYAPHLPVFKEEPDED